MKPIELWNKYYSVENCIDDKLYIDKYNLSVGGKLIHYIEKKGKEYLLHLCDPSDLCRINYSPYGTPEESLTYKFALANRRDFGTIPYVTDKDYVVNSYHVDPREYINWADKLKIEGRYLELSPGGAISYIETEDLSKNPLAIIRIIQFMHEHIIYAEINHKIGVCHECGYIGDIPLSKDDHGNFIFTCPNCGNTNDNKMDVTARICGYLGKISAGNTNRGRLDDIYHRVIHTDCKEDLMVVLDDMITANDE